MCSPPLRRCESSTMSSVQSKSRCQSRESGFRLRCANCCASPRATTWPSHSHAATEHGAWSATDNDTSARQQCGSLSGPIPTRSGGRRRGSVARICAPGYLPAGSCVTARGRRARRQRHPRRQGGRSLCFTSESLPRGIRTRSQTRSPMLFSTRVARAALAESMSPVLASVAAGEHLPGGVEGAEGSRVDVSSAIRSPGALRPSRRSLRCAPSA
jgi:hypothetical protein